MAAIPIWSQRDPIIGGYLTYSLSHPPPEDLCFMSFLTNSHGHYSPNRIENMRLEGFTPYQSVGNRFVHSGYVTVPTSDKEDTRARSVEDIRLSSEIVNWLKFRGIVLHLPRRYHLDPYFIDGYTKVFAACQPPCELYFENVTGYKGRARDGEFAGLTPLQILHKTSEAVRALPNPNNVTWGLCLDTAHLFVQGQPLTTQRDAEAAIREMEGLPVGLIHLNGSCHPFDSGKDQHCHLTSKEDWIWNSDHSGLVTLLRRWTTINTPMILERPSQSLPSEYEAEIDMLKKLMKSP
jgi:endonuclease IV